MMTRKVTRMNSQQVRKSTTYDVKTYFDRDQMSILEEIAAKENY